uniref:Uncharacterized protein n=1 Tax=Rhizophora mucronata TaxID=61149 RepID=A0A2P2PZV2_RHIMU
METEHRFKKLSLAIKKTVSMYPKQEIL